ncbi:hypothetical protein SAMN05216456_3661 [Devosia crocina]|uniref:Uncharacterized protein n=1 Tax=Devosia crocina TaxID=429728 RepID=A0A1I7NW20_9HYPH|nr:hypothetical protein [Devosia crocina]SFV38870.1 hypothetical protein SAMN05216456_3661 [Devosia crocina]
MPRLLSALAFLALSLNAAVAQDQAPQEPAPGQSVTIDPLAKVNSSNRQSELLTGLYATQATIELCGIDVIEPGVTAMAAHRRQLQGELRMDEATGESAYAAIKADVEKAGVDCAEGSTDRTQANAVIAIYSGN